MQAGAEVIVHSEDPSGHVRCHAYDNLRLANPVLIVLADYGSSQAIAYRRKIQAALDIELRGPLGGKSVPPSCGGTRSVLGSCHARGEAGVGKLLVLIGDDHSPPPQNIIDLSDEWAQGGSGYSILPLFPLSAKPSLSGLLPASAAPANAQFWDKQPEEALHALLGTADITTRLPRIFISYRQVDSAALAIQLFDELSHAGFDVFLDHFRIPPGVNFQSRLTQELGDKSMILLLESARLSESQWVAHEIAVAKACGLGLLGLLLPGGQRQASLEEGNRIILDDADFAARPFDKDVTLVPDAVQRIVLDVRRAHDRAVVGRRRMIEMSFEGAVLKAMNGLPRRLASGAFEVVGGGKNYRVWLSPYPPDTPDFHRAHGNVQASETGVVIGLSRLMEPATQLQTSWLANLCCLRHVDEGQIAVAATQMAKGQF